MIDSLGNLIPEDAFIIRHTEISEFRNCNRRWRLASHNGLNLEPLYEDPKRIFGTAWHTALEALYKEYKLTKRYSTATAMKAFHSRLQEKLDKLADNAIINLPDGETDTLSESVDEMKELGNVLLPMYGDWANSEAVPQDRNLTILETEKRLIVPLGVTSKLFITAKIDTIVKRDNSVYIMEHKTSSKSSSVTNPGVLDLDLQLSIQIWIARKVYPQLNIVGAIYNAMRKQLPSNRVKAPIFGRTMIYKSTKELANTIDMIRDRDFPPMLALKSEMYAPTYNPQPLGVCSWGCKFKEVCMATNRGEDTDSIIQNTLKQRDNTIWEMLEEEVD